MTHETAILLLIAGVILGSTAGYVLAFRKSRDVQARADAAGRVESELRSQFQRIEAELSSTREKLSASEQARVVAETNAARLPALDAAAQKLQSDLGVESTRAAKAEADATAAARRLEEQRQQHEKALIDLRAAHEKAVADLRDAFKALSADALQKAI